MDSTDIKKIALAISMLPKEMEARAAGDSSPKDLTPVICVEIRQVLEFAAERS